MAKLNWSRNGLGREGFDTDLGRAWRVGEAALSGERPDGADSLKLLETPSIYWASELAKAFPRGDNESMARLFKTACQAARSIYARGGWTLIRMRVQLIHKRSSNRSPFPSACYAIFFDFWAMIFAREDYRQQHGTIPKHVNDFSSSVARWNRGLLGLRAIDSARGTQELLTPEGLDRWLFSLVAEMEGPNEQA